MSGKGCRFSLILVDCGRFQSMLIDFGRLWTIMVDFPWFFEDVRGFSLILSGRSPWNQRARRNAQGPWRLKIKLKIPILTVLTRPQGVAGLTTPAATPATPLLWSRNWMILGDPGRIVEALGAFWRLILLDFGGFWSLILVDFWWFCLILIDFGGFLLIFNCILADFRWFLLILVGRFSLILDDFFVILVD